jgi:serine/threonine-protein kinase
MGVVYQARQASLNRLVALKMILAGAHAGADDLARFRTEAEAVAALRHPHVVQIYEIGQHDDRPYFSLEYVEGGNLAQKLAGTPQPPRQAAALIETLARAVHFAHQQGLIHRDLKPANVLLAADGTPKIADFGLAKRLAADAGQTRSGEILGTPSYMAPEQVAREGPAPVGTPADVYALGAILYEMLAGRPPFQGPTAWDVLTQVVSAEPTPPRLLWPQTPADLETICLKCLQKEPQRRYGSAEALAEDLGRFLTGRPIQARRVGMPERAVKWVRRNRVVAALAVVVLLATMGGAGGWLWAALDRAAADRLAAARLSRAEGTAGVALDRAQEAEDQAAELERAADDKGREEPETAKQALELRRQAGAALDEAERALADVLGPEAAQARLAERRREVEAELQPAEQVAGLLSELDRARAARARTCSDPLAGGRSYAAALSAYGLDVSRPEGETAAQIREARPGVRLALILALDDWASEARSHNRPEAERLSRIAGGADDDDWRRRYRAAIGDMQALKALAGEAPGLHLPAVSMVQLGLDLYTRGAGPEAAALLRAARRQHPGDYWVYYELDNCLFNTDRDNPATQEEAEACACAAVALRPDSAPAQNNLGNKLRARGDLAGAAACYKKAVELDPGYVGANTNLGDVLYNQGDRAGAAECYKKAIELNPEYANAHNGLGNVLRDQGDLAGAAACYKKAIELDPKCWPAHYNLGNVLDNQGDLAAAAARYKKAIALNPRYVAAHFNLGVVLYGEGNLAGAAECYKKVIELDPKYADAHNNLGIVLDDQGDRAGAAACYKKAIEVDPKHVNAHCNLGNVLYDQGDLAGAAVCYKKAIELDPKHVNARNGLGNVLRDQGDRAGAAECYQKVIELDPKYANARLELGNLLMDQGDLPGAAECYKKAIELDPKWAAAQLGLGNVLDSQGDRAGATECYKKAVELDPKYWQAHNNLGNVLYNQGDRAGAAACYKKAIELDPKYSEAHFYLGVALLDQAQFAEARGSFRRCLDLLADGAPLRASASDNLRRCDRLLALEAKLAAVLKGEQQPADDAERLGLAEVCEYQHRYAAAARLRRDALAHDAKLADDLQSGNRYTAAADAARAGCGQGADATDLDGKARAGWRKQALTWLRADLELRAKQLDGGKPEDRKAADDALRYWQTDAALARLRDAAELAKLPSDEQEAWRKHWRDVQSTLDKAGEKK